MPKYSILIPVHNGEKYITDCLNSIISIDYSDYEIIISENYSNDKTLSCIEKIAKNNNSIRIYKTPRFLSQIENWNNAIKHATGEWCMLLGSDDAVTPYFFRTADVLTKKANQKRINIIKANRIYFFWNDEITRTTYHDAHINYSIKNKIYVKKTRKLLKDGLYKDAFFDMPQMYTTSMFRRTLIESVFRKQKDTELIKYLSPDAYLGVLACCLEKKCLYSEIPLGWVGSSSSSTGLKDGRAIKSDKPTLPIGTYRSFDANTYKTINSTEILLAGSYGIIKKLNLLKYNNFEIDIQKLCYAVIKGKCNDEIHSVYIKDFLDDFGFTQVQLEKKYATKQISPFMHKLLHLSVRVINKIKRIIASFLRSRFNCQDLSVSICEDYLTPKKRFFTYKDINAFILKNPDISKIFDKHNR